MSIAVPAAKRNGDLFTKLFTEARRPASGVRVCEYTPLAISWTRRGDVRSAALCTANFKQLRTQSRPSGEARNLYLSPAGLRTTVLPSGERSMTECGSIRETLWPATVSPTDKVFPLMMAVLWPLPL